MQRPPRPDQAPRLLVMGQVVGAYGVQGWLHLRSFAQDEESLLSQSHWWLAPAGTPEESGDRWRSREVLEARVHGKALVAHLAGVPDREAAARMRGTLVAVPKDSLPPASKGEYFWADLIGLAVVNLRGEALGQVAGLLETGAHDVLRVAGADGKERLIPFVAAYVGEVDPDAGKIVVDWELDY